MRTIIGSYLALVIAGAPLAVAAEPQPSCVPTVGNSLAVVVSPHLYPAIERPDLPGGTVELELFVSAAGVVRDARVLDSTPERLFDRAALRYVMKLLSVCPRGDRKDRNVHAVVTFVPPSDSAP